MIKLIKNVLWPEGPLEKFGRLLGGISLLGILKTGLGFGLVAALARLFSYYERFLTATIGQFDPYIVDWLADLSRHLRLSLHLHPHWRHIFVLLGIYFFREVGVGARIYGAGYAIFNGTLGLLVALVFSVGAGAIPNIPKLPIANFLIGALPVFGAAVYGIVGFAWDATFIRHEQARMRQIPLPTWWGHFTWGFFRIAKRSIVGLLLLWGGLQIQLVQRLPEPGLVMFALLILALACYWLFDGALEARKIRRTGEEWVEAYQRSGYTRLGIAMISTFVWVLLFLGLNAGLAVFDL